MTLYRIVETDNFDGDYPNEKFLGHQDSKGAFTPSTFGAEQAERVAMAMINAFGGVHAPRYWKVVESTYQLQPGFEPRSTTTFTTSRNRMNTNLVTFTVPVTTYKEVTMSAGMKALIEDVLKGKATKISTIKAVRQDSGIGLKEAKDIVDGIQKSMDDTREFNQRHYGHPDGPDNSMVTTLGGILASAQRR